MTQFDEVLQAYVIEVRGDDVVDLVRVEFAVRVHLPRVLTERRAMQFLGTCSRSHSFRGMGQVSEHKRRGQHVDGVILPTIAIIEQAGQHIGALEVQIIPHTLAQQRPWVRLALKIRGVTEEVGQNRTDNRAQTQLFDGVALIHIINADLSGGGATHHAGAKLTHAAEVVGHCIVAILGVDRHIRKAGFGLVTIVDQAEVEIVKNRVELATELGIQRIQVARLLQNAD